jgi:hypothetical protein
MSRNIRRVLLAIAVAVIVTPAAVSDAHEGAPQAPQVAHHAR